MKPSRLTALAMVAAAAFAPAPAPAQTWSVGRPDLPPDFAPPAPPAYRNARPPRRPPPGEAASAPGATVALHAAAIQPDPDSTLVDALQVVAKAAGPAMWRVRRGDAEVLVLGSYSPVPHLLQWDEHRLSSALDGARAVLMPPEPKVGVWEAARLSFKTGLFRLPGFTPLQETLPGPLRVKFDRAARLAQVDPRRYAKWRPAAAGLLLVGDYRRAAGLSDLKPGTTIARLARARHVRVQRTARLGAGVAVDALASLSQSGQMDCLDAATDQVLFEAAHARAAADAWAHGDLRAVKANTSDAVLDRCLLPQARVSAVLDHAAGDAARAIEDALGRPGRTVAVIDLRLLNRPNGVLDRLQAQGAEITAPGG